MDCDEIDNLLADAFTHLHSSSQGLMANCLRDFVFPIMLERERQQYRYVLESECPDAPGQSYEISPKDLTGQPAVDPKELHPGFFDEAEMVVYAKRVRIT